MSKHVKVDSKARRAVRQAMKAGLVSAPPKQPEYNIRPTQIAMSVGWVCAHWAELTRR